MLTHLKRGFLMLAFLWGLSCTVTSCEDRIGSDHSTAGWKHIERSEVTIALTNDALREFCVVGITPDNTQIQLSKTTVGSDLYMKGRFWVKVPSRTDTSTSVSSEFYNDPADAIKALNERGVVEFRTCARIDFR